jgi:hypothetical protein
VGPEQVLVPVVVDGPVLLHPLPGDDLAEPVALVVGHVPHQAEQRQRRRCDGRLPDAYRINAGDLLRQRLPVVVQPGRQHRRLVRHQGRRDPFHDLL